MKTFKEFLIEKEDYVGEHSAPDKTNGAPLYDLSGIYPDDIYTDGPRQYGDNGGDKRDIETINIIKLCKNKPNKSVVIYRAVPYKKSIKEQIEELESIKAYILKYGKVPRNIETPLNSSQYYEFTINKIQELEKTPEIFQQRLKINPGDWVTLNKQYAIEHGRSNLNNMFKVISKTVTAKCLFTDGNSIHEWGYDPIIIYCTVNNIKILNIY